MSDDDKKRDRALQRRVRERQDKTGEGYQAAWRQLTDQEKPGLLRYSTGIPSLDTVLGGGLVSASVVLLTGKTGSGRTALTLRVLKGLGVPCLYVSPEGVDGTSDQIHTTTERSLAKILNLTKELSVKMIAIDTIHPIVCEDVGRGSESLKACVDLLLDYAKTTDTALWIVSHVTPDNDHVGSETLTPLVDVVLKIEPGTSARERIVSCADRNRFGSVTETACFKIADEDLLPISKERISTDQDTQRKPPIVHAPLQIQLKSSDIKPLQPTRVTGRAANGALKIEHIMISSAGTTGGAADWIINDILIDGRSQIGIKDLPGSLFSSHGIASAPKSRTRMQLKDFDTVERDHELTLVVTYIGTHPDGAPPFFAAAFGSRPPQRPTVIYAHSRTAILCTQRCVLSIVVQNAPFQLERFQISGAGTMGGAADWIVNDIRIDNQSQFIEFRGDVPGDLFEHEVIDNFVKFKACKPGDVIEIEVTYIGLNDDGGYLAAALQGTVLREDYTVPPPDLRVLVNGKPEIAKCQWRSPASDNQTR